MSTASRQQGGIDWVVPPDPDYPDSDGKPMSENTTQYEWIVTIVGGLRGLFRHDPNVFVAGDLLWYPVQGRADIRMAPDALVVFGRPRGERGSYMQWREEGIAPQVVFEVLSPGNRTGAMNRKRRFYEQYGVEEYYVYNPDNFVLLGYLRDGDTLRPVPRTNGWISPRLQVRFDLTRKPLRILGPDGQPFKTFMETMEDAEEKTRRAAEEREKSRREQRRAARQQRRADEEQRRADEERHRADEEQRRADEEQRRADEERHRAERLAAQLRALGIEPEI